MIFHINVKYFTVYAIFIYNTKTPMIQQDIHAYPRSGCAL